MPRGRPYKIATVDLEYHAWIDLRDFAMDHHYESRREMQEDGLSRAISDLLDSHTDNE